jgi:hypothetical protein
LGLPTDWKGELLPRGIAEEVWVMDNDGKLVTQFGLPLVSGNQFRANRNRVWSYDTNHDGIDELIFLDNAGLTAIDPFGKKLIWAWTRPQSPNLHLHAVLDRPGKPAVGIVNGRREVFGINLSNGDEEWIASDKTAHADNWAREEIHLLCLENRNPRVVFLNDQETVCISPQSTAVPVEGDRVPVPMERTAARDPRFFRYLPWVESNPFVGQLEFRREIYGLMLRLLACLPMLLLFVVIPWFWLKQIFRAKRFSLRSLLSLIALISIGVLIYSPQGNQVLQPLGLQYENLWMGLIFVLPVLVFIYSMARIVAVGQWQLLSWVSALNLVLVIGLVIAALVASRDLGPGEVYVFDYAWTLILWLIYVTGATLILLEVCRICWSLIRYLKLKTAA